jgi:hypothetical protein
VRATLGIRVFLPMQRRKHQELMAVIACRLVVERPIKSHGRCKPDSNVPGAIGSIARHENDFFIAELICCAATPQALKS